MTNTYSQDQRLAVLRLLAQAENEDLGYLDPVAEARATVLQFGHEDEEELYRVARKHAHGFVPLDNRLILW